MLKIYIFANVQNFRGESLRYANVSVPKISHHRRLTDETNFIVLTFMLDVNFITDENFIKYQTSQN